MEQKQFNNLQENVKHGDFMFPFVQYVSWIPGSFTSFSMHWHKEVEIIYVDNGYCEINIDLERHVLKQGDIVIVKPYSLHSLKQYKSEEGCLFSFLFDIRMLSYGVTDACYVKYLKPFMDGKFSYPIVISKQWEKYDMLQEIILGIHQANDAGGQVRELNLKWRLERLFYILFREVFQRNDSKEEHKQDAVEHIKVVLDYINEHYQNPISIQELASLLHFSEPYFMRFFKKHTGTTCVDYINDVRMAKAAELLSATDSSIMEVAMQAGMHNISYFNRVFKKKYQMTPKEYRKKNAR